MKKPELWWWKYRASKWRREWREIFARMIANRLPNRVVYFATIRLWSRVTVAVESLPHTEHWSRTNVPTLEIGEALTRWEYYSGALKLSDSERELCPKCGGGLRADGKGPSHASRCEWRSHSEKQGVS